MTRQHSNRYCADPDAISAMKRDGLGWGHDVECGCFHTADQIRQSGLITRVLKKLKRED
ncbi:hypothetical protein [Yoonia litorea]|uniref:Uncharacterized protein n=1 Tax=Yoonia litorea TaxID=1123755 RepID=A0A1I6M9R1_9RHOB|nr:hypothetical protein [Yoonia litorea]SFS12445.1 hypothetical protein SAMN05444714_1418 [Yoonia litorea]